MSEHAINLEIVRDTLRYWLKTHEHERGSAYDAEVRATLDRVESMAETRVIRHAGYAGCATFDAEAGVWYGEVAGIRDVVTFEAATCEGLDAAFRESLNDYLAMCRGRGEAPLTVGQRPARECPKCHVYISGDASHVCAASPIAPPLEREAAATNAYDERLIDGLLSASREHESNGRDGILSGRTREDIRQDFLAAKRALLDRLAAGKPPVIREFDPAIRAWPAAALVSPRVETADASPWPLRDVLLKLAGAADLLLDKCDYDGHGWEETCIARDRARELAAPRVETEGDAALIGMCPLCREQIAVGVGYVHLCAGMVRRPPTVDPKEGT